MNVLTAAPTSDMFGITDKLVGLFRRYSQTSLNVHVVSQDVGRVITAWDDGATTPTPPARLDAPFPTDVVDAVNHVAEILGLSDERVINAAQVAPRTYYGWKTEGRRPRPQSLGRLWPLTEAVHFMARAHPNLSAWFHGIPEAQALFDAGDVRALVQLELDWALRTYPKRTPINPDFGDSREALEPAEATDRRRSEPTVSEGPSGTSARIRMDDVAEVALTSRRTKRS
jgi:hypothetical protein